MAWCCPTANRWLGGMQLPHRRHFQTKRLSVGQTVAKLQLNLLHYLNGEIFQSEIPDCVDSC